MKILITGSTGQLGTELLKQLDILDKKEINIFCPSRNKLDFTNSKKFEEYIKSVSPDIIINLAAFTAVDKAESSLDTARKVNALALKSLANFVKENGGHIIQISTDYVFNGEKNSPYKVNDERNPLGFYGKTKTEGEIYLEQILKKNSQFTIIRTSWLVSPWRNNFVKTILKKLKEGNEKNCLKIVSDQIGCITTAKSLSKLIVLVVEKKVKKESVPSHLHWSSAGESNWYEIALKIKEFSSSINLVNSKVIIKPIKSIEYKSPCPRPKYSLLDTSITTNSFKIKRNYWQDDLEILLKEIKRIKCL